MFDYVCINILYQVFLWVKKVYHSLKDYPHCLQRGRCRKIGLFSFLVCCSFFFFFFAFPFSLSWETLHNFLQSGCQKPFQNLIVSFFAFLLDRKACQSPIMETGRWKVSVSGSNGLLDTSKENPKYDGAVLLTRYVSNNTNTMWQAAKTTKNDPNCRVILCFVEILRNGSKY